MDAVVLAFLGGAAFTWLFDKAWQLRLKRHLPDALAPPPPVKPPPRVYLTTKVVFARYGSKDECPGYEVLYPDGSLSWCPAEQFERTSRPLSLEDVTLIEG